jgi:LemA protein
MKGALIALFAVVIIVLVAVSGTLQRGYNQLQTERNDVDVRWAQLDKDIKARADIAVDLARKQDAAMADQLAQARASLLAAASRQEAMSANNRIAAALLKMQKRDPLLRTDQRLQDVQQKLATDGTDYNEAIQKYNTDLQLFPRNLIASAVRLGRYDAYFKDGDENHLPK